MGGPDTPNSSADSLSLPSFLSFTASCMDCDSYQGGAALSVPITSATHGEGV